MMLVSSAAERCRITLKMEVIRLGNTETVPTVFGNLIRTVRYIVVVSNILGVVTDLQAYSQITMAQMEGSLEAKLFQHSMGVYLL
ncbi:hypothetical protein CUMW_184710 [Citrus unshiu]|uniref:Uncharacterized protein n=1 Tax=Citrus unshiu TaxID=55188 RepID=A0A2H5Q0G4_CITUN|nr:hypothetical protein CUMW_184710 [Citrus unshiu]